MKYSEFEERQGDAIKEFYLMIASLKAHEEQEYTKSGMQLLLVGNGGGVALLATFVASLGERGLPYGQYVWPMGLFLLGAACASLSYIPLIAVANGAATHVGTILEQFFQDKLDSTQLTGYSFSTAGRAVFGLLILSSVLCFFTAVIVALIMLF